MERLHFNAAFLYVSLEIQPSVKEAQSGYVSVCGH